MIPAIGKAGPITALLEGEVNLERGESPSLTYRMDWERKRITGQTDGLEAVQQAAAKILRTDRFEHLIYSSDYGTEWRLVLGRDGCWLELKSDVSLVRHYFRMNESLV